MSYTPSNLLRVYIIDNLTEEDTWGLLLNDNWKRLEQAITGVVSKAVTSIDITLNDTAFSATISESQYAVLLFTGVQSANINCIIPNRAKHYFIINNTTSLDSNVYTITIKTTVGSGVAFKHGVNGSIICLGNDTIESIIKTDSVANVDPAGRGQLIVSNNNNVYTAFAPTFPAEEGYILKARGAQGVGLKWEALVLPTIDQHSLALDRLVTGPEGYIPVRNASGDLVDTDPQSFLNLIPPDFRIVELGKNGTHSGNVGNIGFVVRTIGNKFIHFGYDASSIAKPIGEVTPLTNAADNVIFTKIYGTANNFFAIDSDKRVWAWGRNSSGMLGFGHTNPVLFPTVIPALSAIDIDKISCVADGYNNYGVAYFLETTSGGGLGRLYAAGSNAAGNLGNSSTVNSSVPVQCGSLTGILDVSCGSYAYSPSVFAWHATKLWAWGYNTYGALGLGDFVQKTTPTEVTISGSPVTDVLKVANQSRLHTLILRSNPADNIVYAAGENSSYELGQGNTTDQNTFVPILSANISGENPIDIFTYGFSAGVSAIQTEEGNLWFCGYNNFGVAGNNTFAAVQNLAKPLGTNFGNKVSKVAIGGYSNIFACMVLDTDNKLWSCGYNSEGNLGLGNGATSYYTTYQQVPKVPGTIIDISMSYDCQGGYADVHTKLLYNNGVVYGCGAGTRGQNSRGTLNTTYSFSKVLV